MSFGEVLLLKKLGLSVLTFTGIIAFLLGGWIMISAYSGEPDMGVAQMKASEATRQPSSIGSSVSSVLNVDRADSKVETLTLACLKNGANLQMTSMAKQIRLKSQLCGGRVAVLKQSSILNRANGFEATLYNLANGTFTSDYISLEAGPNQILFEIEDAKGLRAVAEVIISRDL